MNPNLANIRRFLLDYFNDEELTELCFDHFHEVYQRFSANQTKGSKARLLIDYCHDRQKIAVLLKVIEEARPEAFGRTFSQAAIGVGGLVNLNTAEAAELMNLPGIGPRLAQAIIYGRPYKTVDDLRLVSGFGLRRFSALRDWVMV
jgi:competence ComEA-like helix-hairpin-helix protein